MNVPPRIAQFSTSEDGSILFFWAAALAVVMGLLALTFDIGRMASTQTELQSFADSVALAAAAELDGKSDAIQRAEAAAAGLISDSQTFGSGDAVLAGSDAFTLTYYSALAGDDPQTPTDLETDAPQQAHYVGVTVDEQNVSLGFGAAFAALAGEDRIASDVGAEAVAGFALEACDITPITMCLPSVDFQAEANIGKTLQLKTQAGVGLWTPGTFGVARTLASQLDGLSICGGLLGGALDACLLAARNNRSGCYSGDSLDISADLSLGDIDAALNVRMGMYGGIMAGASADANFSAAPNVLQGLVSPAGICLPNILPQTSENIGLPTDDCVATGTCSVLGNGDWTAGRAAYIDAHYGGKDPHPEALTRYDFYKAEIAARAAVSTPPSGGLLGGLGGVLNPLLPKLCSPTQSQDPKRRLMVVAGVDCGGSANVSANATDLPVREFFEVFMLGPAENGTLSVEITACLGGACGKGETGTDVRDIVRLAR